MNDQKTDKETSSKTNDHGNTDKKEQFVEETSGDWIKRFSKSKNRPYYYNTKTKESVWDKPADWKSSSSSQPQAKRPKDNTSNSSGTIKEVTCSHILVKHNQSRNPSSWKEKQITRSKEEAIELLKEYQLAITSGASTFQEIASEHSDCSSAKRGGDLGPFGRGKMMKPFEDAAFGLKVGEMSDIVSTDSGVHIILRTA
mmetsp:Transcript_16915/g.23537  ORF Transcript_16915/g.23537 Transcript_16915/m.23537 type:complete len:199 (-) Transcript_16915:2926-3522(-)